jgi:hypothetical protein
MDSAKSLKVRVISSRVANDFVRKTHYSGSVVQNSKLHFGVYYNGFLHGVMSFGSCLDKSKMLGIVKGTTWNGFLELNRMAFDDKLPKNSESRAIAVALRLIKKKAPHIDWIVSFADATQCGSGTIYRASGFLLTKIKTNNTIWEAPDGKVTTDLSLRLGVHNKKKVNKQSLIMHKAGEMNGAASMKMFKDAGYRPLKGYQLRYIKFLNKDMQKDLTCPIIPYSELDKLDFPEGVSHKEHLKHAQVV